LRATPEWSIADMLRHMWSWNELVLRALEDWPGPSDWLPPGTGKDEDTYNAELLAANAGMNTTALIESLSAAYGRYATLVDQLDDDKLNEVGTTPWGAHDSYLRMIAEIIGHDAEHATHIAAARGQDRTG